jgi:alkylation response protein AidB-like acyl-CoA dehydrogenase
MAGDAEERRSMQVAEAARESAWASKSFMRELFLGRFRLELVHPFPDVDAAPRPEFKAFYDRLKRFLREEVDPAAIDASGEYPRRVVDGLRRLGAFGMKIPREYGGLGFTQLEYARVMELLGSYDGNVTALLSAHQSIGVPQPLALFGTEEQKRKYLPRCARGAISAFALTEPQVGSDPARLATTAEATPDGTAFVLNGEKLWTTNGTIAELLVVMARDPATERISAFVVETSWPGVKVEHRCRFMGLKALANGVISLTDVRVPRENLIGEEGRGLKIALVTLNTGRLTLPAAVVGLAKQCLETVRKWSNARVQWGQPIGRHEAVAHMIADMAATTFAMEAVSDLASSMADAAGVDIRLEAAAAKEWNTTRAWEIVDTAMQIRGGRGYETEASLAARGEPPLGIERMMRDSRINRIFEGSSEIMHLFMAREAVDRHLQVAGVLVDPSTATARKLAALPGIGAFYARWYPTRWLGWGRWPRYGEFGVLAPHLRFAERASRRLARAVFHGMARYRGRMQYKQAFLFRAVDVANELFAVAAVISRAQQLAGAGDADAAHARELADLFCRSARRRVRSLFRALWHNDDARNVRVARHVLAGEHAWLERGIMGVPFTAEELVPPQVHPAGEKHAAHAVAEARRRA